MIITEPGFGICAVTSSLALIAHWVETLHGQGDHVVALEQLGQLTKSNAAITVRFKDGQNRPLIVSAVNIEKQDIQSSKSPRSYARQLLANNLTISKPGSIWYLSEINSGEVSAESVALAASLREQGITELAIVALEVRAGSSDYLELHFNRSIQESDRRLISALAGTLSRSWRMRLPGSARKLIENARSFRRADINRLHSELILGVDNPKLLSRSEYRVCVMVKDGLLVKDIAEELSIKQSTVRSHLRSIYAKTSTSGHVALLHRLIQGDVVSELVVEPSTRMQFHEVEQQKSA